MRATALLACAMLLVGASTAQAAGHSRLGEYQDMGDLPRDWATPYELRRGIPMVDYGSFRARNPVTAAQYGLANWSLWIRYEDRPRLRTAVRVATWLVRTQQPSGTWVYRFDYRSPGTTMTLEAPWASALAQGQAISLLRRAYAGTGRRVYLRAARRALGPLRRDVEDGGLAVRRGEGTVFEEYPTERPSLPLNGHLQALIGLYDLADVSAPARRMLRTGVATTIRMLPQYDDGSGWTYYNLAHQVGFEPFPAPPHYHAAHVLELRVLDSLWPHARFRAWADRWARRAELARR